MKTVVAVVGSVLLLAAVAIGGFFVGRYVLESQADVKSQRLQARVAELEKKIDSLVLEMTAVNNNAIQRVDRARQQADARVESAEYDVLYWKSIVKDLCPFTVPSSDLTYAERVACSAD